MFGISGGRGDPGDLRQLTALHIFSEIIELALGPSCPILLGCSTGWDNAQYISACGGIIEKWCSRRCGRILIEVKHRAIREVAREGIAEPLPISEKRRSGRAGKVLIDLPTHPGFLQHFGE